ncbi:MAG: hypothetical protein HQL71_03885 [Magnetococcales bacterium]|nr:hypothetical protein [Magnetococcales bacterium]
MKNCYARVCFLFVVIIYIFHTSTLQANDKATKIVNAVEIYKQFATAMIMENLTEATTLAKGKALRTVRRKQYLASKGKTNPIPQEIEIIIVGETISKQQDEVNVMGVLLARNKIKGSSDLATVPHRQETTLQYHADGWKVVYFMDNLEKCCIPAK